MNNNRPDISLIIRDHGPGLLDHMRHKQKERGVSNAEIINLAGIPQSSFYRLWNGDGKKMDHDHVARICLFLGISIDDFLHDTTDETKAKLEISEVSHEDVMTNIHEEIGRLKNTIEQLQKDISERDTKIMLLEDGLKTKTEEMVTLHATYADRIDKLKDVLIERHTQMHEMNRIHNERIDEMNRELKRRYDHIYDAFYKLAGKSETSTKIESKTP